MRRVAKVDANHRQIVVALEAVGCSVQSLHQVGDGCPDLLVGHHGCNYLLEVKDGMKRPSARRLTPDQVDWHGAWRGQKAVVENVEDAIAAVGVLGIIAVKHGGAS